MIKYYYYVTHVAPVIERGVLHFKATSKKQIKQYLTDRHISLITIFDPYEKPVEGVNYIDISDRPINH